jgi:hypothetical protein
LSEVTAVPKYLKFSTFLINMLGIVVIFYLLLQISYFLERATRIGYFRPHIISIFYFKKCSCNVNMLCFCICLYVYYFKFKRLSLMISLLGISPVFDTVTGRILTVLTFRKSRSSIFRSVILIL